jgi:hypothetical protein
MKKTRFACCVCGLLTAGRVPVNPHNHRDRGDGTFRYARMHKGKDGLLCPGSYMEAKWIDIDVNSG